MIQHSEQRFQYSIERDGASVAIEIVNHYMDHISPICGEIDHRALTGITVEGDIPYPLKLLIVDFLIQRDYIGAEEALDQYLLSVLATEAVQS